MSAFGGPWVRYACACGYTRDTLDAGEPTAPCAACGAAVAAEALDSPAEAGED